LIFVIPNLRSYKNSCSTNNVFFSVCTKNYYNILIVVWFIPLHCCKQTTFNTESRVGYRNGKVTCIVQQQKQDRKILLEMTKKSNRNNTAVKINDRYMRFADYFFYRPARLMHWSWILMTDFHDAVKLYTDKFLTRSYSNRGGREISSSTLTDRLSKQTLPQQLFWLTNPRHK